MTAPRNRVRGIAELPAYLMEITPRYVAVTLERAARAGLTPRRIG